MTRPNDNPPPDGDARGRAHHTASGFRNPDAPPLAGFRDLLKWQLGRGPAEEPPVPPEMVNNSLPRVVAPDTAHIAAPDPEVVQLTWIGHSSFLLQMGGRTILIDPVFSERCSPSKWIGPRRRRPPGLSMDELPRIDIVLISHDHYDHLDEASIRALGSDPLYIAPLGVRDTLLAWGAIRVWELDWWMSGAHEELLFTCLPAQHFSGRTPFSRNGSLWSGWSVAHPDFHIYYAGDTGWGSFAAEIGKRLGPFDLALIPIGAYRPRWFMHPVHIDPAEAIAVHRAVGARRSIATHWGTFPLSDEPPGEPPAYLVRERERAGLDAAEFAIMAIGETRRFPLSGTASSPDQSGPG